MTTTARQIASAVIPVIADYRDLLKQANEDRRKLGENPEVEDPSVVILEALVLQVEQDLEPTLAVPSHLTTRLANALSCSIPTLQAVAPHLTGESRRMVEVTAQAQQELVDSCRAESMLAEKLGYAWRSCEDTSTRGEKGLRIDSDEVSLLAWFSYGVDAEGPARAQASVRRMLACMRACEGISTELLESVDPGELDAAVNDGHRDPSHPMLGR